MALGENIRTKRKELKLSQEYVADQLSVSREAVSILSSGGLVEAGFTVSTSRRWTEDR